MTEYLTPEQREELERQLAAEEGMTEQQRQAAFYEGARMAQSDMEDGEQAMLREHGFEDVEGLITAYERTVAAVGELKGMLRQLLQVERAHRTAAKLDPAHPEYAVRRQIELELRPMRSQARQAARSRLIQQSWQESAAGMNNLEALLPEIAEYIMSNPRYSAEEDGFQRAYDAVRSAKYRGEEEMLNDPEFVARMAADERVREAALRAHLEEIRKGGQLPQAVGAGQDKGKTMLSAKRPVGGMEQAKKQLEAMLKGAQ